MKKGLRKLILSGTALAAVAATLGTSTYAWYTANETVSATDISGASAGATDASIFISKDHTAWSSTVALNGEDDIDGGDLLPVEYISGATDTFKLLNTASGATGETTYAPASPAITSTTFTTNGTLFTRTGTGADGDPYVYTNVLSGSFDSTETYYTATTTYTPAGSTYSLDSGAAKKFTLYFRSSKINVPDGTTGAALDDYLPTVYLKNITLTNTTEDYTPADNLYYTKTNGYGVNPAQATYGVDFTQALKMVIRTDAATAGTADGNVNTKSLDLVNYEKTTRNSNLTGTADALGYYNNIMGTNYAYGMNTRQNQYVITSKNTSSTSRTPISLGRLNSEAEYITVDFYIYLDGWDTFCYDACKGQNFQLDLDFTSDVTEALTYAA